MHQPNPAQSKKVRALAQEIAARRKAEIDGYHHNKAFLRAKTLLNGAEKTFNLINKENKGGHEVYRDVTGQVRGTTSEHNDTLVESGSINLYKNLPLGEILIKNSRGEHTYIAPKGQMQIKILGKASYVPRDAQYAIDLKFEFTDDLNGVVLIADLKKYIKSLDAAGFRDIEEELENEKNDQKRAILLERLKIIEANFEAQRQNEENRKTFIRYEGKLRYQPTLDPIQEDIKRKHRFTATLAIDGGPGTGKTTSLIQRIKFLIDAEAMQEYLVDPILEKHKKRFQEQDPWLFFSPSELLKHFLEGAMTEEGLRANDQRVKVWQNHLDELASETAYKLFNPQTEQPFLKFKEADRDKFTSLISFEPKQLKSLIKRFEKFTINEVQLSFQKALVYQGSGYSWDQLIQNIKNDIEGKNMNQIADSIRLFMDLQRKYASLSDEIISPLNTILQTAVADLFMRLDDLPSEKQQVYALCKEWYEMKLSAEEEDIDDDQEDDESDLYGHTNVELEKYVASQIRSLLRKYALKKRLTDIKLTKRQMELVKYMPNLLSCPDFDDMADRLVYQYLYHRLTRGVAPNMINKIPQTHKRFRREEFINDAPGWNLSLLAEILNANPTNKRLHNDEKNLLVYFINERLHEFYARGKMRFDKQNHHYFSAFKKHTRPVIGVDEATDFSPLEILCMYSLRDPDIGSVTFSGDLMQRFSEKGLKSWHEVGLLIKPFEVEELRQSYRQTATLLELANALKKEVLGGGEPYLAATPKSDYEPKPLALEEHDRPQLIDWLAKRIIEIRKASEDKLPSIAVFLTKEGEIEAFANELSEHDTLFDYNISVKACRNGQVLGDANTVRVFSVEYIKGLEFEAVFFPYIEQLKDAFNQELMMRYIHVGLSRASFYLGVTSNGHLQDVLPQSVADKFERDGNWRG